MHDIKYIKDNTKEFDNAISKRGGSPCGNELLQKYEKYLSFLNKKQELQEIERKATDYRKTKRESAKYATRKKWQSST